MAMPGAVSSSSGLPCYLCPSDQSPIHRFADLDCLRLHLESDHAHVQTAQELETSAVVMNPAIRDLERRIDALFLNLKGKSSSKPPRVPTAVTSQHASMNFRPQLKLNVDEKLNSLALNPIRSVDQSVNNRLIWQNRRLTERCVALEDNLTAQTRSMRAMSASEQDLKKHVDHLANELHHHANQQMQARKPIESYIYKVHHDYQTQIVEMNNRQQQQQQQRLLQQQEQQQQPLQPYSHLPMQQSASPLAIGDYAPSPTPEQPTPNVEPTVSRRASIPKRPRSVDSGYTSPRRQPSGRSIVSSNAVPRTVQTSAPPTDPLSISIPPVATLRPAKSHNQALQQMTYDIDHVTTSALRLVFTKLQAIELAQCAKVNKTWRQIATQPEYWEHCFVTNRSLDKKSLMSIVPYCEQTRAFTVTDVNLCLPQRHVIETSPKTVGALESALAAVLQQAGEHLEYLKIANNDESLSDRSLWLVSMHNHNLKHVIFSSNHFAITSSVLWSLGCGCRHIETLILSGSDADSSIVDVHILRMIAKCWHKTLKSLAIAGNSIRYDQLNYLGEKCKSLEKLDLIGAPVLTVVAAKTLVKNNAFKSLTELVLTDMQTDAEAVLVLQKNLSSTLVFTGSLRQSNERVLTVKQ